MGLSPTCSQRARIRLVVAKRYGDPVHVELLPESCSALARIANQSIERPGGLPNLLQVGDRLADHGRPLPGSRERR